jgi:hypothetical protein
LLTEALLLAAIGTAVALPLAWWARQSLGLLVPPVDMPLRLDAPFNAHILAFSILLCVAAAVISGLVPALHAARPDLVDNLKEGGRGGSAGARAHRMRDLLVAGEVALAMVAIAGAGLFAKSFRATTALDPGFDPHNVLVAKLYLSPSGYTAFEQRAQFVAQVKERLETMPGVAGVSYAETIPLGFQGAPGCGIEVGGYLRPPGEAPGGDRSLISPGYFRVMKTPLLAGREFTTSDDRDHAFVAVVNEEFARHYMAGRDPLGVTIRACSQPTIIVGLVKNSKSSGFVEVPRPVVYLPLQQRYGAVGEYDRGIGLFLRSSGEVKFAVPLLRSALKSVDPAVGVYDGMAYEDYIRLRPEGRRQSAERPRRHFAAAGGHGAVQRDGLFGEPAHPRDRHPHGARRPARQYPGNGAAEGPGACADRHCRGHSRRTGLYSDRRQLIARREPGRPAGVHLGGAVSARHRGAGNDFASTHRNTGRPADRTALRMSFQELRQNHPDRRAPDKIGRH